jgi:mono/diheme cytochrome c family protein
MKTFKLFLCLSVTALFIAACGNASVTTSNQNQPTPNKPAANAEPMTSVAPPDEFAASRKIYKDQNCVRCHKEDGTGGITEMDGNKFKTPDLTSDKMKKAKDEDFISTIENGEEEMPAFKTKIKPEEIKELVRFIRKEIQRQ